MSFSVIILAAGQGTRMNSVQPKVLQLLSGKPLLHHMLSTVKQLAPAQTLVVCGYMGEVLQQSCKDFAIDWVWQTEQRGTGHAVKCAYPDINTQDKVLVLYGDMPLISAQTLQHLIDITPPDALGLLTAHMPDPTGFGRIVRNEQGQVVASVEQRDATAEQLAIQEINPCVYVLPYKYLATWLSNLNTDNQQQEYYLTDVIAMAVKDEVPIVAHTVSNLIEVTGVNSQQQLADLERHYQLSVANTLLAQGAKLYDPKRIDVRGDLKIGRDVTIDVNVIFEGNVILGDGVVIGPNVVIKDSVVENGVKIYANSVIDSAVIGENCQIGPFARLRPGSQLHKNSKVGNFVETKNVILGAESKINHLSYVGDAEIGARVNIGAGVITCNYDGAQKHKTIIEDEAFIGSNCELIAPVTVGKGATLAAGTTLTKDAPAGALTLTKKVIANILNWRRPVKHKEEI